MDPFFLDCIAHGHMNIPFTVMAQSEPIVIRIALGSKFSHMSGEGKFRKAWRIMETLNVWYSLTERSDPVEGETILKGWDVPGDRPLVW